MRHEFTCFGGACREERGAEVAEYPLLNRLMDCLEWRAEIPEYTPHDE
jgi:hypothetical protein